MRSMTGYGSASTALGEARVVVDVRALNHRFLDLRVRLPPALSEHAGWMERAARERLERGHVEINARVDGPLARDVHLDRARARAAYRELAALKRDLGTDEPVPLSLLASVPDLFHVQAPAEGKEVEDSLRLALQSAFAALEAMRDAEGAALAADLGARLAKVRELRAALATRAGSAIDDHRARMRERLERLLAGSAVTLDRDRLEQEIVLLADRSDIAEELTRLESHAAQFAGIMSSGESALGRKLEFVLQEMGREANTISAKSSDAEMTRYAVDLKVELERMREQIQNVL